MIDLAKLFDGIRNQPFTGSLTPETVRGVTAIVDEWKRRGLTDLRWLAAMLATVLTECGARMLPVREGFKPTDAAARAYVARRGYKYAVVLHGHVWYGRGLVQLTWYDNYVKFRAEVLKLFGVDIAVDPDAVLRPDIAAYIMFEGMIRGMFTGKKLSDYFNASKSDWVWSRAIINGKRKGEPLPDRAEEYAGYAKAFYADLLAARTDVAAAPVALPVPAAKPESAKDLKQLAVAGGGTAGAAAAWQMITGSGAIRIVLIVGVAFAIYWFIVRPLLRRMSALEPFYAKSDAIRASLWSRVVLASKGARTLLWGRALALAPLAGVVLQFTEVVDFSMVLKALPPIGPLTPEMYGTVIGGAVLAYVNNWLRKVSNTAAGQTDLALAPPVEPAPPLAPELPKPSDVSLSGMFMGLADQAERNEPAGKNEPKRKRSRRKRAKA